MAITTLGEWKARVNDWMGETMRDGILADAINDAIQRMWMAALKANLSLMMGGPVELDIAAGVERQQIVSIPDPLVNPSTSVIAGGALGAHNPYVAYTYVTESGSETNLSPSVIAVIPGNNLCQQNPPARVANALGWNCYMGSVPNLLARQNDIPLTFSQSFLEPVTGAVDAPDLPLPPTENTTADDIFYIRRLEVPLVGGGYKKWQQADIDSQMFSVVSRQMASTSEFQNYAYDFVNQRQIEIRPATGTSFAARYFYIHKPRRLRFDSSTIPFFNFPYETYLREKSMAECHAANRDWEDSNAMETRAAGSLLEITSTIAQQNWGKDQFIEPYMR